MIETLPALPGLARHGALVRRAFARAVAELGWGEEQADALAAVIEHESGWRAGAVNGASGASGLIQFMPKTARGLGTTVEELRRMSEIEQLPFVVRFYRPLGPGLAPRDVPVASYLPSRVGQPDETVTFERGSTGYAQNAGLDIDRDGRITLGEVRTHALQSLDAARARPRLRVDDGPSENGAPPLEPTTPPAGGATGGAAGGMGGAMLLALAVGGVFLLRKALG
jgi:hypothetical protein